MMLRWMMDTFPQILLYLLIAPWVVGLLNRFKARYQGRQGPSSFQPYRDIWKYMHRRGVIPETASWVFSAAPFIVFGCYGLIGTLVPVVYLSPGSPSEGLAGASPSTDFLIIVFLIGLAHFALALAGMDSGSPLGGMGSSREMYMHILVEPVLILVAYSLAVSQWTTSLSGAMSPGNDFLEPGGLTAKGKFLVVLLNKLFLNNISHILNPSLILIILALVLVMMAETGRMPFDNQDSHLELTMISKALRLEYSGHNLGFLEWAGALRLTFFLTLLVNLFIPGLLAGPGRSIWVNMLLVGLYPIKLWVMTACLAAWESAQVRLRLRGVRTPGGLALAFAIFAVILTVINNYFHY